MTRDQELEAARAVIARLTAENAALAARAADAERHVAERGVAEERARVILESVRDAFFSLDRDFRFTYLNPQAERFLLRAAEDLTGKVVWEEFPAAVGTQFDTEYHRAMRDRVPVQFVEHYPAPLDRWYEVRADPTPEGLSVYFQDITERLAAERVRAQAEDEIRRGRDQMELVVRSANIGVWYCPLPFDVLSWDVKVKEHFHLPPDAEVTIETFYERIHPDDRALARAAIDRSIATRESYDVDYRTLSPDGRRTKWIRSLGRAYYDEAGRPQHFDGITIDVSDRKRGELALRESEERYRLATRATDDAIWDWDLTTDLVEWNEALAARFGHELRTTPIAWWMEAIHPDDRAEIERSIQAVIDDPARELWEREYRFRRGDGAWADVLDRGYVLRGADGVGVRMLGAIEDRTAQKAVERQRERMVEAERAARAEAERQSRTKDEFLATLSHELRTPLNAVLGWATLARQRSGLMPETARALAIIERNARAQARIVDDLLDMTSIRSGKLRLDLRPVDVGDVIAAAVGAVRPTAEEKGVTVDVELGASSPPIEGDPARLQQAIGNLLGNAIKFSRRGGRIAVRASGDEHRVEIRVADEGEGIAPDFLPHVFERFRQADSSTTRRHGGLGLGLPIAQQIVELHGGTIAVASDGVGRGAAFTVTLPAHVADGALVAAPAGAPGSARPPVDLAELRVLVVDDEEDARTLVARILEERRAVVTTVATVDDAMREIRGGRCDLVVADIGMPGEDGFTLARRLRGSDGGEWSATPAIALTAYTRREDRDAAVEAGFDLHLAKPVHAAELVRAVAQLAARARATP